MVVGGDGDVLLREDGEDDGRTPFAMALNTSSVRAQPLGFLSQVSGKEEWSEQTVIRIDKCLSDANCAPHLVCL